MEFNALAKTTLLPVLSRYGFKLAEEFKNILKFESRDMKVNIAFNEYEKSYFVEIGRQEGQLYPLDNNVVKSIFGPTLTIEQTSSKLFLQSLITLFTDSRGCRILAGDITTLESLIELKSEEYTKELTDKQVFADALNAWKDNDYRAFVKCIEKIGMERVPKSYQLKYEIAKRNLPYWS